MKPNSWYFFFKFNKNNISLKEVSKYLNENQKTVIFIILAINPK